MNFFCIIFSPNRKGEDLASHGFPLWLVELPRVVKEDRTNCCLSINTISRFHPYSFPKTHLHGGFWKPGKCHEDLLLLVEVPTRDCKDDPNHSKEESCEENKQTTAGWLRVNLVHLGRSRASVNLATRILKFTWTSEPMRAKRIGSRMIHILPKALLTGLWSVQPSLQRETIKLKPHHNLIVS